MINIRIAGKKYGLPNMREMSINRFCEFLDFCDSEQPEAMRTGEDIDPMTALDYYAKELAFWTGCPLQEIRRHDLQEIAGVWALQQKNLQVEEDSTYNCINVDDVLYYLPQRLMTDATIEDFAEANEYEKQMTDLLNGVYKALPKVAAVLLRKKGEGFDDYDPEARAELFGEKLTAYDAFQVGFFLQRQSEKSQLDLRIFMTSRTISQLKQASKT